MIEADNLYEIDELVNINVMNGTTIQGKIEMVRVTVGRNSFHTIDYVVMPTQESLKKHGSYIVAEANIMEILKPKCPSCNSWLFDIEDNGFAHCGACSSEFTKDEMSKINSELQKIAEITASIDALGGRLVESQPSINVVALELFPKMVDKNAKIKPLRRIERNDRISCYTAMSQFFIEKTECDNCGGTGEIYKHEMGSFECPECDGTGVKND